MSIRKIAVVGAGAVGCYYGARLARHFDVSFLMRRDLESVREHGLHIESVDGDFTLEDVAAFETTDKIGPVDLVVIALKATANGVLLDSLPPLLKKNTVLLTLQNGLGNEEFLASHFPGHPILGGLCFVCINRGEPGKIQHLAHGLIELSAADDSGPVEEVGAMFRRAEINCRVLPDLGQARWRKLVWNVPFNGLAIAAGGIDTQQIIQTPELERRTRALMLEIIAAAAAHGYQIDPEFAELNINRTREMGPYQPSSLVDFLAGNAIEVEPIWGEPLRRAKERGVDTPELERLYLEICAAAGNG